MTDFSLKFHGFRGRFTGVLRAWFGLVGGVILPWISCPSRGGFWWIWVRDFGRFGVPFGAHVGLRMPLFAYLVLVTFQWQKKNVKKVCRFHVICMSEESQVAGVLGGRGLSLC